jgi:RimJ/RimL family protein N-acetyltransferase
MVLEHQRIPAERESCRIVLETERLVLRMPTLADVKAIASLANDRRIAQNTSRLPHPYTVRDAETFIQFVEQQPHATSFAITCGGDFMGTIGVMLGRGEFPEIGYWLGLPYWGQGYATEAARAIIDYAFEEFDCTEIRAGARVVNTGSRRVLEKCGFQWTNVQLLKVLSLGGSVPVDRFRLDRGVWTSLKNWKNARRTLS